MCSSDLDEQIAALNLAAVGRNAAEVERRKACVERAVPTDEIAEFHVNARFDSGGY